jgi:hypothetical protein
MGIKSPFRCEKSRWEAPARLHRHQRRASAQSQRHHCHRAQRRFVCDAAHGFKKTCRSTKASWSRWRSFCPFRCSIPTFTGDAANDPAVVGGNVEVSQRLVDTLIKALGFKHAAKAR